MGRLEAPGSGFTHIAVIRLSSLGDVVLSLPVVHALRAAWPDARIDFWVKEEYREVVDADPAITHVRPLEPDNRRIEDLVSMSAELEICDLIVDLQGNARSRLLTWRQPAPVVRAPSYRLRRVRWVHARWSRPAPVPTATERYARALRPLGLIPGHAPRMSVAEADERWAADWLAERRWESAPVALCPGARHATKRWPERHWVDLFDRIRAAGTAVVCLSLEPERQGLSRLAARVTSDRGAAWCTEPLPRMAALLSLARGVVSGDSGLMHVAAARGARVVALFGSTSPVLGFAPAGEGHAVLCRNEPCQPCTLHGREACPRGHFRCMEGIEPADVEARLG